MLTGTSSEDSETAVEKPDYVSKHLACPDCDQPMILYGGLLMCGCGHQESCCE